MEALRDGLAPGDAADRDDVLAGWLAQADRNRRQLLELLASVQRHRIPPPHGTQESLVEYDRRRSVKETLLEEIIQACVETGDAARMIRASMARPSPAAGVEEWEQPVGEALAALVRGDAAGVRAVWPEVASLAGRAAAALRGARARRQSAADRRRAIDPMHSPPFLGLSAAAGIVDRDLPVAGNRAAMETSHPVGPGGVTEFDRVFEIACKAVTQCLAISSAEWYRPRRAASRKKKERGTEEVVGNTSSLRRTSSRQPPPSPSVATPSFSRSADAGLIDRLEELIEVLLRCWLSHSRGVRLSVLETVADPQRWRQLKRFIERYGGDLFTQRFMNLGNLRGILHQGVREYLRNAAGAARARRAVPPVDRTRHRHSAGRGRALAGHRHRGRGRELRRIRRLQQHHDAIGSRRDAVHAAWIFCGFARITTGWPGTSSRWRSPTRRWFVAAATAPPKSGAAPSPSGPRRWPTNT